MGRKRATSLSRGPNPEVGQDQGHLGGGAGRDLLGGGLIREKGLERQAGAAGVLGRVFGVGVMGMDTSTVISSKRTWQREKLSTMRSRGSSCGRKKSPPRLQIETGLRQGRIGLHPGGGREHLQGGDKLARAGEGSELKWTLSSIQDTFWIYF